MQVINELRRNLTTDRLTGDERLSSVDGATVEKYDCARLKNAEFEAEGLAFPVGGKLDTTSQVGIAVPVVEQGLGLPDFEEQSLIEFRLAQASVIVVHPKVGQRFASDGIDTRNRAEHPRSG